uniref:Uncharacterized protein n=1 Tax=viral metagenome TaxID=1070528 RepID=A0A6C0BQR5_9ZZZZ
MGVRLFNEEVRLDIVVLLLFIGGCIVYFFFCSCNEKMLMNAATTLPYNKRMINNVKRQPTASCGANISRRENANAPEPASYSDIGHMGSVY